MANRFFNPDSYGVAAFRSRQQVLRFDQLLREQGIPTNVISTPRGGIYGVWRIGVFSRSVFGSGPADTAYCASEQFDWVLSRGESQRTVCGATGVIIYAAGVSVALHSEKQVVKMRLYCRNPLLLIE